MSGLGTDYFPAELEVGWDICALIGVSPLLASCLDWLVDLSLPSPTFIRLTNWCWPREALTWPLPLVRAAWVTRTGRVTSGPA